MHEKEAAEVRLATAADAEDIARLIVAQYGQAYAEPTYTDPAALRPMLASGDVRYAVARVGGEHVGQMAVERRSRHLWEFARALVSPAARNHGVLLALDTALLQQALRVDKSARFFFARSVTHHLVSQRHGRRVGAKALGLLLGVWPASMIEGAPDESPISALLTGRALAPVRPRRLALEGRVRELAEGVLGGLEVGVTRERMRGAGPLGFERSDHPASGLLHLRIGRAPGSLYELGEELARAERGARVTWVDVPAEHPRAAQVVASLEQVGFSFGAYLPFGGLNAEDVVRLQRCRAVVREEQVQVLDDHVALRGAIVGDAAAARSAVVRP